MIRLLHRTPHRLTVPFRHFLFARNAVLQLSLTPPLRSHIHAHVDQQLLDPLLPHLPPLRQHRRRDRRVVLRAVLIRRMPQQHFVLHLHALLAIQQRDMILLDVVRDVVIRIVRTQHFLRNRQPNPVRRHQNQRPHIVVHVLPHQQLDPKQQLHVHATLMQIVEIDHVLHRPVRQRVRDVPEVLRLAAPRRSHLRTIEKPVDKDELLHVAPRPASFAQFKQFQRTIAVLLARDRYSSFHVSTILLRGTSWQRIGFPSVVNLLL